MAPNRWPRSGEDFSKTQTLWMRIHMTVEPNTVRFSAGISACGKAGQWRRALGLLGEMIRIRVEPNTITLNAAISPCSKWERWEQALELLGEMVRRKIGPPRGPPMAPN